MVVTMNDPVIDEVHRVRKVIAAEFGPDFNGIVEHYAKLESRFKRKPMLPTDRRTNHCIEGADQTLPDGGSPAATR